MATPGTYTVTLTKQEDGVITQLGETQSFEVVPLREGTLEGASSSEVIAFRKAVEKLQGDVAAADYMLENSMAKIKAIATAYERSDKDMPEMLTEIHAAKTELMAIDEMMNGDVPRRPLVRS